MFPLPRLHVGGLSRLVLALAVAVAITVAAVASIPALLVLPFFPAAADRADRLIARLIMWTVPALTGPAGKAGQ